MVTHDPELAAAAPRQVRLRDGRVEHDSAQVAGTGAVRPSIGREAIDPALSASKGQDERDGLALDVGA
jgi:hypothetical protein